MTYTRQSHNRYATAARLLWDNPVEGPRFMLDRFTGRDAVHRLVFGDIVLTIRSLGPDLKVIRSCLLGELDDALNETHPDARFLVDAGGYIGLTSILMARRFPKARVICLEPSSENYALTRENCAPYSNIVLIKAALGVEDGSAVLRDANNGQWGFTIAPRPLKPLKYLEEVEQMSLRSLMARFAAERIDLLKMDIEGSEYDLLDAAESWIGACHVLLVELHGRFRPGVERLYQSATADRREVFRNSEKRLSVADLLRG